MRTIQGAAVLAVAVLGQACSAAQASEQGCEVPAVEASIREDSVRVWAFHRERVQDTRGLPAYNDAIREAEQHFARFNTWSAERRASASKADSVLGCVSQQVEPVRPVGER